ncbi:hypothetical protein [Segetibacter aerophilus]|uniref:Lipoprotein n=1 Tax=Segetibacter aerophilus TaxID=670293 RepID=A0A512BJC9_9BACT|nr:hypothetical protein [Segetibacter aerophilus]GEO12068.1 hypothetical protein SAE01_45640 [Segetibacter aerophilus]
MKKISVVYLSGLLLFAACENGGSSTVGSYEKEETSQSSEKSEGGAEGHSGQAKEGKEHESTEHKTTEPATTQPATTDTTLPTSGDTRQGGSAAEIKTGANVPVDTNNKVKPRP